MSEHKRSKLELDALAAATACLREATLLEAEPTDLTAADIYRAMAELITDKPQAIARAFVLELATTIGMTGEPAVYVPSLRSARSTGEAAGNLSTCLRHGT